MFTHQDCGSPSHSALDPHQELLAFHGLDRQLEIACRARRRDSESLSLPVDITGTVAGMGPRLNSRSGPRPEFARSGPSSFPFSSAGGFSGLRDGDRPWAGTYHGIGARLLREYAEQIGLDHAFTIHDREGSADLGNLVRHERALR